MFTTIRNYIFGTLLLLAGLAVSLHGAEPVNRAAASAAVREQQKKSGERVRLARSMGEFISELDLFDNHLYGRVQNDSRDGTHVEGLRGQLQTKNDELKNMIDNPPPAMVREGEQNFLTTDAQNYCLNLYNLENEISGMLSRLHSLENGVSATVATELLDGSMWRTVSERAVLDPGGEDLNRILSVCRKTGRDPKTDENNGSGRSAAEKCGKPE